jgi:nitroimidazol reductase NimA-like FMN-containing flavoprotein (pyridoxamine 5'-phosphate oxidase superfamily)
MDAPARDLAQRTRDALRRLAEDEDAWVATAGDAGPYLVPLSFLWDGATLLFGTVADSPTGRNVRANAAVRLGVGPTRDLLMIDGTAEVVEVTEADGDAFAARTGFDPRRLDGYFYFRVRPARIQAWREANEIPGRTIMRDGEWRDPRASRREP